MLPYLTASVHIRLAKSAYLFLQMIHNLLQTHLDVHTKFQGYVVWRIDRYWGGTVYRSHHRTGSDDKWRADQPTLFSYELCRPS